MAKKSEFTVKEAALIGHCSGNTILTLLKAGRIKGHQEGPKTHWTVTSNRQQIREAVHKYAPNSGWRKNASPVKQQSNETTNLVSLLELNQIPSDKRDRLVKLANKFSVDELDIILSL